MENFLNNHPIGNFVLSLNLGLCVSVFLTVVAFGYVYPGETLGVAQIAGAVTLWSFLLGGITWPVYRWMRRAANKEELAVC
jgi:hypothetical protein